MHRRHLTNLKREISMELEKDLYVSDVDIADRLIEEAWLTPDDWQSITNIHRPTKKVKQLVKCLGKTGDPLSAYTTLCNLLDLSHKHLAPKLRAILNEYENKGRNCINCMTKPRVSKENSDSFECQGRVSIESPIATKSEACDKSNLSVYPCINSWSGSYVGPCPEINNLDPCVTGRPSHSMPSLQSLHDEGIPHDQPNTGISNNLSRDSYDVNWPDINRNMNSPCENTDDSSEIDESDDLKSCFETNTASLPSLHKPYILRNVFKSNTSPQAHRDERHDYTHLNEGTLYENDSLGVESDMECNLHFNTTVHSPCDKCIPENTNVARSRDVCSSTNVCHDSRHDQCCCSNTPTTRAQSIIEASNELVHETTIGKLQPPMIECDWCFEYAYPFHGQPPRGRSVHIRNTHSVTPQNTRFSNNGVTKPSPSYRTATDSPHSSLEITATSSESERNTDVNENNLMSLERKVFRGISDLEDGNLSEIMDCLVEQGLIDNDDITSINKKGSNTKRRALLAKLVAKPKKVIEHDDRETETSLIISDVIQDSTYVHVDHVRKHVFYKYPSSDLKNFWNTFDSLNYKVNHGVADESIKPTKSEDACITYFLQACDKLYHNDVDAAERLVEAAKYAAESSTHQLQLRGEVLTAKTWLYLETDRLGKMHDLLEQYDQLLAFMPGIWSSNAYGWFYHDYARCFLKLSTCGSEKQVRARMYYKAQAIKSARKAIDCFKASNNSDGPIGMGFAASLIVDALLDVTNVGNDDRTYIACGDIEEAEQVINFMEIQFKVSMPPILKASYLINKCSIYLRKQMLNEALEFANQSLTISRELNLHSNLGLLGKILAAIKK